MITNKDLSRSAIVQENSSGRSQHEIKTDAFKIHFKSVSDSLTKKDFCLWNQNTTCSAFETTFLYR